ncbi:MAG: hypothetical protein C0393_00375 [Anaerolinea sp.]|nr:hypothetical protein [Anaerolinea sp.]
MAFSFRREMIGQKGGAFTSFLTVKVWRNQNERTPAPVTGRLAVSRVAAITFFGQILVHLIHDQIRFRWAKFTLIMADYQSTDSGSLGFAVMG